MSLLDDDLWALIRNVGDNAPSMKRQVLLKSNCVVRKALSDTVRDRPNGTHFSCFTGGANQKTNDTTIKKKIASSAVRKPSALKRPCEKRKTPRIQADRPETKEKT